MSNTDDWTPPTQPSSAVQSYRRFAGNIDRPIEYLSGQEWLDEYNALQAAIRELEALGAGSLGLLASLKKRREEMEVTFCSAYDSFSEDEKAASQQLVALEVGTANMVALLRGR